METPPSVEDTLACIATLYHNPNPEDKNRANQWLQSLQNSVYAWKVNYHEKFRENATVWPCLAVYNFDLTRKIVNYFSLEKNRENVVVLPCFVFDNFDLTRKI